MQHKFLFIFFGIALCSITIASAQKADMNAEKAKVTLVVNEFTKIWETKDMTRLSKIVVHDSDMVNYGINSNLVFVGWNALKDSIAKMWSLMEMKKMDVRNQVINVNPSGNVAWYSELCDMNLLYSGHPMQILNQRYTGVLEKRNGNWVIVQFHNSITCQ